VTTEANGHSWKTAKVRDLSSFITVGFVGPMSSLFVDDGVPLLRGQNILPYRLDLANLKYISASTHREWKKSALQPRDVVIVRVGYPGTACVIPPGLGDLNAASLVIVRPDPSLLDSDFLCYVLNSPWGKARVQGRLVGVAQQVFNTHTAAELEIPVPPLPVQRRIANILSAYHELIENNLRRVQILEAVARAVYREWFVDFGFPGHENCSRVASAHGDIPVGWAVKTVQQFGTVITGKTPSKANTDFYGDHMPFVKTPDMHKNMFVLGTTDCLSAAGAASQVNKTLPAGSICVSCIGTIGVVSITTENCQTNQQINSIVLTDAASREFLFFRLQDGKQTLENLGASGATMGNVNKAKFETMEIVCPPDDMLVRYHQLVAPMFAEIFSLFCQIQNLRLTRDLLLPRLLSGQIDVAAT
jgi:type I restriction enzyme S subunit